MRTIRPISWVKVEDVYLPKADDGQGKWYVSSKRRPSLLYISVSSPRVLCEALLHLRVGGPEARCVC